MSLKKVPSLSLKDYHSSDTKIKQKFVKDLFNSFEEYGFVVIKDHPIKPETLKEVYAVQKAYFDLPLEEKMKNFMNNSGQRGYTKFGTENAKGFKASDLKEFYHVGREVFLPNTWPQTLPNFQPITENLVKELDSIGNDLLSALGESVGCGPKFLPEIVKDGASVLRLLHYPPVPETLEPNQIRSQEHRDICALTLLVSANGSGLQLLTKDGDWLDIESDPDSIVCNIGDLIERMCNYKLPSTTHRVVNPKDGKNESRYSLPYFIHPRSDVRLDLLPKYANETPVRPITTAGEYLHERLKEIGLKK